MKNLSSCSGGVTRLQLFSQLVTRTIRNKMADALSRRHRELWLAHSDKIALQVAEEMLHASNLSRNVAKSRGLFYFSYNSQRNYCSCKMGCYMWFFFLQLATQRLLCCKLQEKLLRVTWPLRTFALIVSAHPTAHANSHATSYMEHLRKVLNWTMIGQMAIAIALLGFDDLGRSVTPSFLFRNRFYLQVSPHCPKIKGRSIFWCLMHIRKESSRILSF